MTAQICPDCGATDCAAVRDVLLARDFEQPALYWQFHRLAVDAYCVQHPSYVASAKSLAAHLCGLCITFEHGNDATLMRALQRWLSSNPAIQKPELPVCRGRLTIESVNGISDPVEFGKAVNAWARSAWEAYSEFHPLAQEWLIIASYAPSSVQ